MEHIYKKVGKISFGVLSPEMIKKIAVCKIVTPELYDKEGYPVDGGLMDVRMGVIDPGLVCPTDGKKLRDCPGYFGYVELARPVIHIKYVDVILAVLRCFCRDCNRILITEEKLKEKNFTRKKLLLFLKNVKKCPHCQIKQYVVKIEKPTSFVENDRRLSPIEVQARIEKVTDEDLKMFGMNPAYSKPEWMVLNYLPIPPVTMRPSITLETGERSEDDLTHKLSDVVRINQRLFENINAGAPEIIVEDLWDLLQYHITTYFDNSLSAIPPARHRGGQPLKTLTERMKSKEGRFRHNLAGKRVNFSARTFITPDPRINFNEVGVPLSVAMELTIPEKVNEWNLEHLKKFVENGAEVYPGANYFFSLDGKKKKITDDTKEQILEEFQVGCIIERHLLNGDVAIFNRQPSLHRMSIMCHKVKILPGKSFRLNPSVCTPYNADFDGDEMNLHIPQTEEARAEAEILMEVETQLISPKNGLNIIGTTTDVITGNYLLTKHMKMLREEAIDILYSIGIRDFSNLKSSKMLDGRDVFSAILPKNLNFIGSTKEKEDVIIKNGKLIEGIIDKATIGEDNGTLIRRIHAVYGEQEGIVIINRIFRLGIEVLLRKGFTSSISDTDLSKEVLTKNRDKLNYVENKVKEIIEEYQKGKLELLPGMDAKATVETLILKQLNQVRDKIGENVYENVADDNPTIIMARAGAKGNFLNLAQMSAMVGQQAMGEGRINIGYKGRTLSLFRRGELSPEARGFIREGYKQGLTPVEFFFHSMTGRDSLMDTALRTPKSGYLYRRLANALQDMRIEYDNTVRDASGKIVQFSFGDDGLDVAKTEGGKVNVGRIVREVKANV